MYYSVGPKIEEKMKVYFNFLKYSKSISLSYFKQRGEISLDLGIQVLELTILVMHFNSLGKHTFSFQL